MTSAVTRRETERRRAEREAWSAYRESLQGLEGRDYEDAERISWERLQRALRTLALPDDHA
jgi:hypothetical protein